MSVTSFYKETLLVADAQVLYFLQEPGIGFRFVQEGSVSSRRDVAEKVIFFFFLIFAIWFFLWEFV